MDDCADNAPTIQAMALDNDSNASDALSLASTRERRSKVLYRGYYNTSVKLKT